ncbi:MAG: hypothetical protein WCC08_23020 [Terrimicrobiaceae bacterium]
MPILRGIDFGQQVCDVAGDRIQLGHLIARSELAPAHRHVVIKGE